VDTNNLKILAIVDQRDNLTWLKAVLDDALPGCTLQTAQDGPLGIALARAEDPDAILLDILTPVMDGFEVCRRLKAEDRVSDIPVIFLTALETDRATRVKALEAGAEAFLTQPPDGQALVAQVRAMAKLKEANRMRRMERDELAEKVAQRTRELTEELAAHQRAEAALRKGEERYRLLFEQSNDAVFVHIKGEIIDVNERACQLMGYGPDELKGMKVSDMVPVAARERARQAIADAIADGSIRFETQFQHKDNTIIEVEVSSRLVDSETMTVQGVVRDITERKRTEEALRESETRFRLMFDSHSSVMLLIDPENGRILDANVSAAQFYGYSKAELTQMTIQDINQCTPEEVAQKRQQAANESHNVFIFQHRIRSGELRTVEVFSSPVEQQGKVLLFSIVHNISERKLAEERLKQEQYYLRKSQELGQIGTWELDLRHNELRWTDENCRIFGVPAGSIVNYEVFLSKVHPEDREYVEREFNAALDGKPYDIEHRLVSEDGPRWVREKADVAFDESGKAIKALGFTQDITERKNLQAQIALADRLTTMGMLAAGVAHEINNPLSYVLYNLESLTEDLPRLIEAMRLCSQVASDSLGADQWARLLGDNREMFNPSMLDGILPRFKDALSGTMRIRDVARGLGTFSRTEDKRLVPVNLIHVMEVAITMALNEIKFRASLVKEYGAISDIMANDGRLCQVFLNLLINAAHAIGDGRLEDNEIRIRIWQTGEEVFAEIRDTGKGIAENDLLHIFKPFFTTKELGVGTGLGLAISCKIIEDHGGRIEVSSKLGVGTRFTVRLPVNRLEKAKDATSPGECRNNSLACGRILIIDDEAGIRSAMSRILKEHEVVQAASGEDGRRVLNGDQAFDLILCDMMMGGMSGVDLHEWLLSTHPALAGKLVFITGGAFTPREREYLNKVSNLRIEKPFDVANFKRIVNERIHLVKATPEPE